MGKMQKRGWVAKGFIMTVFLLALPLASAEILLSQPEEVYNLGDIFALNVTLIPSSASNDFLLLTLNCDNGSIEIYRNPFILNTNERKNIAFSAVLERSVLGDARGDCFLKADYGSTFAESQHFVISKDIFISLSVEEAVYAPKEGVKIRGSGRKATGEAVNGFVIASIKPLEVKSIHEVINGNFSFVLVIPEHAPSGNYELIIEVIEKDGRGESTNNGKAQYPLFVKQVVKKIVIALSSQSILPGEEISYNIIAYDQSEKEVKQEAEIEIRSSFDSEIEKKMIRAGDTQRLVLATNASAGTWRIKAMMGDAKHEQQFNVGTAQKASFFLINGTLVVRNIGNVPYERKIDIGIGNIKESVAIYLEVGGEKRFKLFAPEGDYPIEIHEEEQIQKLGTSFLTGNTVGIKEISGALGKNMIFWIWAVIIALLVLFALIYYRKIRKKSYRGKNSVSLKPVKIVKAYDSMPLSESREGRRVEAAVLALQVKNARELERHPDAVRALEQAVRQVRSNFKAQGYTQGNYQIIIFVHAEKKSSAFRAVSAAKALEAELSSYNRRHAIKISFSIGLNLGEMIIEKIGEKYNFTSIGNTVIAAKMATERSEKGVVVSLSIRRMLVGQIKGEPLPGEQYWKVHSVSERGEHAEFIDKFMSTQE